MRKLFIICVLALSIYSVSAQKMTVDKVVARVGNSAILYSEIDEAARGLEEQYAAAEITPQRDLFIEALELMMERKLAYNQALIDSLTIDETSAVTYAGEMLKMQIEDVGGVRELENLHNMTVYNIQKTLEQAMREQEFFNSMQRKVMGDIKITPGEVELFFEKFPKDSIPTIPEQYMYAQITRLPSNIKEAKEAVRERLMSMREDVINGKSKFETLARLYSEDTGTQGTALRGGELPPLTLEQMAPEWQPAVERLRPGQVSEVVETEYGFQIIQLMERDGDTYKLRYIPMKPKYSAADLAVGARFLDSLAHKIRVDSITFEAAARLYSDDVMSKQNGGVATNTELLQVMQRGGASGSQMIFKFRKDDEYFNYNARDYRELSRMKVGEISDSFSTSDLRGNELSKIVKLLAVYPTHQANMADDYLVLEQAAINAKREKTYNEWLDRTVEGTYVWIDPAYRGAVKALWAR